MLDFARPPVDPVIEAIACTNVARAVTVAAHCAALRVLDGERYASLIAKTALEYPLNPLLMRPAAAMIGADQASALVDFAAKFLEALSKKSAAAQLVTFGSRVSLAGHSGGACIVGKTALWPAECVFSATLPCRTVEDFDMRSLTAALIEDAALSLDSAMFHSVAAMPGRTLAGLMSKSAPLFAGSVGDPMARDMSRLNKALGGNVGLVIAGPQQAERLRHGFASYRVRESQALARAVVALTGHDILLAGLGPLRVEARLCPPQSVSVKVVAKLAWTAPPKAVAWLKDVSW